MSKVDTVVVGASRVGGEEMVGGSVFGGVSTLNTYCAVRYVSMYVPVFGNRFFKLCLIFRPGSANFCSEMGWKNLD